MTMTTKGLTCHKHGIQRQHSFRKGAWFLGAIGGSVMWGCVLGESAFADTFERFVRFSCWPEIGIAEVQGVFAYNNERSYSSAQLQTQKLHDGGFTDSCTLGVTTVKVRIARPLPVTAGTMCGGDPSAHIDLWLDDKQILSDDRFGNSCGAYIASVRVDEDDMIEICVGHSTRLRPQRLPYLEPYQGYSIEDHYECRSLSLRSPLSVPPPIDLRRLFHDSEIAF